MILLVRVNAIITWIVKALVEAVVGFSFVVATRNPRHRSHTNIFIQEFFRCKIVHEVLRRDVATILIVLLRLEMLELATDSVRNLLE